MRKRWMVVLLLLFCLTGCSNFYAKGLVADAIDQYALMADGNIAKVETGQLDDSSARDALSAYAGAFALYADSKTCNVFAYWFGDKQIFVDGEYATRLDRAKVLAYETYIRAAVKSAPWLQDAVVAESMVLLDVAAAKHGRESAP